MQPFIEPLNDVLQQNRAYWAELVLICQKNLPKRPEIIYVPISKQDAQQFADGFITVLLESLMSRKQGIRELFLETAAVGLIERGVPQEGLFAFHAIWISLFSIELISKMPVEHQFQTKLWLGSFLASYTVDLLLASKYRTLLKN